MGKLTEIAQEKLKLLGVPISNPRLSIIPQLMLTVFNIDNMDQVGFHPDETDDLLQEVLDLSYLPDLKVEAYLAPDEETMEDAIRLLEEAITEDDIRHVLMVELLYNRKSEREDWPPRFYNR